MQKSTIHRGSVGIAAAGVTLRGDLVVPENSKALIIFAHGSGSSRLSPRNRMVADTLVDAGLSTLLFDLLTGVESEIDEHTRRLRFDIDLLASRVTGAIDWVATQGAISMLRIGLFGASTGAAAALVASAERPHSVGAIVSRGGRPDLAGPFLSRVAAPTLLLVGENDPLVIDLNKQAATALRVEHEMQIIAGATHLFEEPGTLEEVARAASQWFVAHLVQE